MESDYKYVKLPYKDTYWNATLVYSMGVCRQYILLAKTEVLKRTRELMH